MTRATKTSKWSIQDDVKEGERVAGGVVATVYARAVDLPRRPLRAPTSTLAMMLIIMDRAFDQGFQGQL